MIYQLLAFLAILTFGFCGFSRTSLGDQLHVTFPDYVEKPVTTTEAINAGWTAVSGSCEAGLGIKYLPSSSAPSKKEPAAFYFTPGGQISAVGMTIYGEVGQNLLDRGFYTQVADGEYYYTASFRSSSDSCSSSNLGEILGDRLVINQPTIAFELPLLESEAVDAGWTKGSCIDTMVNLKSFNLDVWFYFLGNSLFLRS